MAQKLGGASAARFHAESGAVSAVGAQSREDDRFVVAWAGTLDGSSLPQDYADAGPDVLKRLRGDGPLVLLDKKKRELLLATDRFGVHPLYFRSNPQGAVFATKTGALALHPGVTREVDLQSVFNYAYFHMVPGPRSALGGVERLEPGEYVLLGVGEVRGRGRYWTPVYEDESRVSERELADEYRSRVRKAVEACLSTARGPVGAFLSGGTDSSTVVGILG
jgi:asparagine synthase (glutamine-hydrolysing)